MAKYKEWLEPEGLLKIEAWARDGLINEQIAHNIGIRRETLSEWAKKYPNISNALKRGKEVPDIEVENSLYKRAVGYNYTETTKELKLNPSTGKFEMMITKEVTKHVVPDTTAEIFWLKNRKPDVWKDKQEVQTQFDTSKFESIAKIAGSFKKANE
ncbi:hypothetical protein [Thomasclavelia cocleata]|uniref:hypothetical protein n=1 Tax=Thomasclavelia cocleata TaxID=69824 RepID=UPI00242BFDED|nr:hypothetical protein [Thomasclavelia cocleata]